MKTLYFSVTNDLNFDQRMIRICQTLAEVGYRVVLIGRNTAGTPPLRKQPFEQIRLNCVFNRGKFFYLEFNFRLFFFLLFRRMDLICAIDLDTILPCLFISWLKAIPRVYDAHELFSEMKEVITRPAIHRIWKSIEKFAIPRFVNGYTVSAPIADYLCQHYQVSYEVVRNLPKKVKLSVPEPGIQPFILYQGAVNEGRSFETLIPAFSEISIPLHIYGEGNFMEGVLALIKEHGLGNKVFLKGRIEPEQLAMVTCQAFIGLTLFENRGLSNYYSLANRFFDYIQAGIPQVCVDYPAYREINDKYGVAILISDLSSGNIAKTLNNLIGDRVLYNSLRKNAISAGHLLNWENESQRILNFYHNLLPNI